MPLCAYSHIYKLPNEKFFPSIATIPVPKAALFPQENSDFAFCLDLTKALYLPELYSHIMLSPNVVVYFGIAKRKNSATAPNKTW